MRVRQDVAAALKELRTEDEKILLIEHDAQQLRQWTLSECLWLVDCYTLEGCVVEKSHSLLVRDRPLYCW